MQAELIVDRACVEARVSRVGTIVEEGVDFKGNPYTKTRTVDNVERSKLIVHTLFQRAKQLAPDKYGDKASLELTGKGGGPIQQQNSNVTPEQLDAAVRTVREEF